MVIDSSTLISLAKSGLLPFLSMLPATPVILDRIESETVEQGIVGGYTDAAAIENAIESFPRVATDPNGTTDGRVLEAAVDSGALVANDLALGRRARNLGVRWLRTADLVLLLVKTEVINNDRGKDAISALAAAGRLTPELTDSYLRELQ